MHSTGQYIGEQEALDELHAGGALRICRAIVLSESATIYAIETTVIK
jgi:hypothetical protein